MVLPAGGPGNGLAHRRFEKIESGGLEADKRDGRGIDQRKQAVFRVLVVDNAHAVWNRRVGTSALATGRPSIKKDKAAVCGVCCPPNTRQPGCSRNARRKRAASLRGTRYTSSFCARRQRKAAASPAHRR